jgi:hypothetical protein
MNKKALEFEKIAQEKVKEALSAYEISDDLRKNLDVGYSFSTGVHSWVLYVPGDRPKDAIDVAEAIMDPKSGEVSVKIFDNPYIKLKSINSDQ